jgi:hypothetical protein
VLASLDSLEEQQHALELGYPACTLVTPETVATHKKDDTLMMLCPHPKHDCRDCMLCANVDYLRDNKIVMMFPAHGQKKFDAIKGTGGCYADLVYMNKLSNENKVTVTDYSQGKKIKGMSVTYASIKHTCPTTCAMYPQKFRN